MREKGFTLIEILIGVALLAILLALVVAAINPAKRFEDARNTQRFSDVTAIMDAVNLNMLDNNGAFNFSACGATSFPATLTEIASSTAADICDCIVPNNIATVPLDPNPGSGSVVFTSCSDYNTQYEISQSTSTLVITVNAPEAEGGESISVSR